jgi:hypothetical protein
MPRLRNPVPPGGVHSSPTAIVSTITGRTVWVNLHATDCAILPTFAVEQLAAAAVDWVPHVDSIRLRLRDAAEARIARGSSHERKNPGLAIAGLTAPLTEAVAACFAASDVETFGSAVAAFLDRWRAQLTLPTARRRSGTQQRGQEFLTLLWRHDLLALPAGAIWRSTPFHTRCFPEVSERFYGPRADLVRRMTEGQPSAAYPGALKLLFSFGGVSEVGDITTEAVMALRPHIAHKRVGTLRKTNTSAYGPVDRLLTLQRLAYKDKPEITPRLPDSYREALWPSTGGRADAEFHWLDAHGPRLAPWKAAAAAHLAATVQTGRLDGVTQSLVPMLDYVIAHSSIPADPLDFCRRTYLPPTDFPTWLAEGLQARDKNPNGEHYHRTVGAAHKFLAGVVRRRGRNERGVVKAEYHVPVPAPTRGASTPRPGKTDRVAMPIRFVRMMREILEAPDPVTGEPTYAWARTLPEDWFEWTDPETGYRMSVWSPVRAYMFMIRLLVPVRGIQVRMLDSGEGDPEVYRPAGVRYRWEASDLHAAPPADPPVLSGRAAWVPNTGPLAPTGRRSRTPSGAVRLIEDSFKGTTLNGLYINTNKTADRASGWETPGYEIPWEEKTVLRLLAELRDFQERYNPISKPLRRNDLKERQLHVSADLNKRLRPIHFLFRDPTDKRAPGHPITHGRAGSFWVLMQKALEDRLEQAGITAPDGEKYILIKKYKDRGTRPRQGSFDPHSLRVAGLTHFVAAGVPIEILSAFVAGHATILMTYYYVKPRPTDINDALAYAQAHLAREEVEKRDFAAFMANTPLIALQDAMSANDAAGLHLLRAAGQAGTVDVGYGLCPAGGALCHEGGPFLMMKGKNSPIHGPVPGGARNCACCRFFVTGTPWLGGVCAQWNATYAELHQALESFRAAERKYRDAAAHFTGGAFDPIAFDDPMVVRTARALDIRRDEVGALLVTLQRLDVHIARIRHIVKQRLATPGTPEQRIALVLGGTVEDFEYARGQSTHFDLVDGICHSADLHPWVETTLPCLRRAQHLDTMLKKNGCPAFFQHVSDEESQAVGNATTLLLRARQGTHDINDLIEGRKPLVDVGIVGGMDAILAELRLSPIRGEQLTKLARAPHVQALPASTASNN